MTRPRLTRADRDIITGLLTGASVAGRRRIRVPCPLCERLRRRPDLKQSLYLHADGGWVCFRCQAAGWLPGTGPGDLPAPAPALVAFEQTSWQQPPEGFTEVFAGEGLGAATLEAYREYYLWRGVGPEIGRLAHVGGCTQGPLRMHVVVPCLTPTTEGEAWAGWVARALYPVADRPTYREPEGAPKTDFWRGEILDIETGAPAIIVEGVFDALPLWPDGAAARGKLGRGLFMRLISARRPVVLALDGDAWQEGDGYMLALRAAGCAAGALRFPPKVDPDERPPGVIFDAARESLTAHHPIVVA